MTAWRYSVERRRYLYPSGRAVPVSRIVTLRERFIEGQDRGAVDLARQLAAGEITVAKWEREVRALTKRAYIAEYALGAGGRNMLGRSDYGRLGGLLGDQYRYLRSFSETVADGELSEAQIAARTTLYLQSATQAFERARAASYGLSLDRYPASGSTACGANCRCSLDIEDRADEWHVRWLVRGGESCGDCIDLGAAWNPLIVPKKESA